MYESPKLIELDASNPSKTNASMIAIAGYQISEKLYESSNSLVYRGCRDSDGLPAILKLLKHEYPTPEAIARFKLEYEIARSLNFEGTAKAYSLEKHGHSLVIVLEDFGGVSLNQLMRDRVLTQEELLTLAIRIVEILDQIHQQGVIHKDINPSNIVVNPSSGQLKIIDFGISAILSRENPVLTSPHVLEGTLAYISPEQTGRMNRVLDYRTDFYSLGATLYELFTHQKPFNATDVLELVHYQLARQPIPPHVLKPDIPLVISQIILKLMAKMAEERYQSAPGIRADLEECLRQLGTLGAIASFPLGRQDISTQLQIPQKLYGREQEIQTLLTAFVRVASPQEISVTSRGVDEQDTHHSLPTTIRLSAHVEAHHPLPSPKPKIELMLVFGYSGIGKSALVREIYKPITRQQGYFIAGKFDQYQRNIPYFAVVNAFSNLVQQLLAEPEKQLQQWREKLLAALGINGQVIVDVIPEIELIIGQQPEVPELSSAEAQNRFNLVFQNFIQVFAQPEHPLVLFLDDLQWADSASLKLMHLLMTALDSEYLFLIGAYRDNEVSPTHPLILTIEEIQQSGAVVNNIVLNPLNLQQIIQLVCDTLYCDAIAAQPLAILLLEKTGGNPFFLKEFLRTLHTEELLHFDMQQRRWVWDLDRIRARDITSNIVELLAGKIQQLEPETQQILKLAACIGNQFELATLATVYENSPRRTVMALREAILAGLVIPLNNAYKFIALGVQAQAAGDYKFAHDRIQQAAYSLIYVSDRPRIHYQIGQLLLHESASEQQENKLFDIVNQLNLGRELIHQRQEREQLAQLNLQAGEKAKLSAAYDSAFQYLQMGLELLGDESWQQQYELTLALSQEATEAAYLSGNFERMEQFAERTLQQARTILERVKTYQVKIQSLMAQGQQLVALQTALQTLALLNIHFPEKPNPSDIELALNETITKYNDRPIETLADLPVMTDSRALAAMGLLSSIIAAAHIAGPELFPLIVFKQVNLSIDYGNADVSPFSYALYGLILCGGMLDIETGYRFSQLALNLLSKLNPRHIQARTLLPVHAGTQYWKEHLRATLQPLKRCYQAGIETGDLEFAGYTALHHCDHAFFAGVFLPDIGRLASNYIHDLKSFKQTRNARAVSIFQQAVLNLTTGSLNPDILTGDAYNESAVLPQIYQTNDRQVLFLLYLTKLMLCCWFDLTQQAFENTNYALLYIDGVAGQASVACFRFYDALARLAYYPKATPSQQAEILQQVAVDQQQMKRWAQYAPMNYQHKFLLVEAERHCVLGEDIQASDFYDRAIALAEENEYIHEVAIAYELAAKFYLAKGKTVIAKTYLQEARYAYLRWGATAKVQHLETCYPQLLQQLSEKNNRISGVTDSTVGDGSALDLATVMKASQAIASELVLERLLSTLLKVAIENAGAQTGCLILECNSQLRLEAIGSADNETVTVLQPIPIEQNQEVCISIIHYVARTQNSLVLSDATRDERFVTDVYIVEKQPKSVLCTPLVNQGKLVGVLYLENNLTSDVFKSARVELLNLLSTQMAIAIENARLLKHQEELNNSLQQEQEQITRILERITDGFIAVNRQFQIIYANQRAEEQLSKPSQELIGKNLCNVYPQSITNDFYQRYREAIDTSLPVHFEEYYPPSNRWFEINAYPDREGLSIFFRDITERKQMEEKLVHDALHDTLTGLPNRLLFTERLEMAIRRSRQQPDYRFAVLFLDVDRFKVINDSLGHLVGDELLVAIARRLETCLTPKDTIARFGGDEFIILLDNPTDAARTAARIQMALNVPFDLNSYKVFNTVSIGIVSSATGYNRPEELLRAADIAMYQAKAEGKARYVIFDTTMQEQATSLLKLETDLRWAIERHQLRVYYQPIVALKTGRLAGFEALVRWVHPEQGFISPTKFIPLAEETGLIIPIGEWVLQEACRQLRIWQLQLPHSSSLTMSVNLSVKQFSQADLIERIDRILTNMDLSGEYLKLEITESVFSNNTEMTRELLLQLRSRNILLCIDDFGTGYSSLSYLHQFPVNILKIDRSFIRRIGVQNQDAEIVRTILTLARNLSVDAIAEGIETAEQLAELRKLECGYGQGYFFAKPLDSQAAGQLITQAPQW